MSSTATKILTALLVVVGILVIVVGVIYWVEPARSLPSFFPGHLPSSSPHHFHRRHRGTASVGVGVLLLIVALVVGITSRRSRRGGGQEY